MTRFMVLACAAIAACAAPAQGQESKPATRGDQAALPGTAEGGWREYRGDARNSGVSHGPPPSFSGVRWKFVADSEIFNSPAVDAGCVYFASKGGRLFAVRTKDGTKVWERAHTWNVGAEPVAPIFMHSSPLLFRGRVYMGSETGDLVCCDQKTGDLVWRRHLGGTGKSARIFASPKTDGKNIFLGSLAGTFWAFDPDSGEVRWQAKIGDEIGASAAILGTEVIIPAADKKMRSFDVSSGQLRWEADIGAGSISTPALRLGCAFLRTAGGKVISFDLVSRLIRWSAMLTLSQFSQTSVAHDGETVYVTQSVLLTAYDAATGDEKWQARAKAAFDASPVVVGPWVVAAGGDLILHAYDRKTGAEVKFVKLTERISGTPAIVDGVAYVPGAFGTLFAVE